MANKCGGCGKFLSASALQSGTVVSCGSCSGRFHKGCALVPGSESVGRDWACPDCKAKVRKGDNSNTPVRGPQTGTDHVAASVPLNDSAGDVSESKAAHRELLAAIGVLTQEMRELRAEMSELRATVAGYGDRVSSLEERLEVLERRESLGSAAPIPDARVAVLEGTVAALKLELNDREQEALLSDLEIGHMPEEPGENAVHAVGVLARRLGVELGEGDVVFAERIGAPPAKGARPRRLVVRLARRALREEMLRQARVRRTLSVSGGEPGQRIFLNERLTRCNRQLFFRARELCRERHWRYAWTSRGRILVKEAEGKQAFRLGSEGDFERVFGPRPMVDASGASENF